MSCLCEERSDEAISQYRWFNMKQFYVYILASANHNVLYTGVTSDLVRRICQHKMKVVKGFTNRYNVSKLVYYEVTSDIHSAIQREKQIKGGSRAKKNALINATNPEWKDLYEDII